MIPASVEKRLRMNAKAPTNRTFANQAGHDVVLAAHRPEQTGQCYVDGDEQARQRPDMATQQSEAAVDVATEARQELIDDIEIAHGRLRFHGKAWSLVYCGV